MSNLCTCTVMSSDTETMVVGEVSMALTSDLCPRMLYSCSWVSTSQMRMVWCVCVCVCEWHGMAE